MAQLTVYIDDETRKKIETAAKRAGTSVSLWVKRRLSNALETEWPDGYFDCLGALEDARLERPESPRGNDLRRDPI